MLEFQEFSKIARLSRECIITEKIDGTNASIFIALQTALQSALEGLRLPEEAFSVGEFVMIAGSRTRWITAKNDNYGFAKWAHENCEELAKLGTGHHFGEWWGGGIQRGYGFQKGEKRFSLFNTSIWTEENKPTCCSVVPTLYRGEFTTEAVQAAISRLKMYGSVAVPGFTKPEGIVVYHVAANQYFKKTLEKDELPKGQH